MSEHPNRFCVGVACHPTGGITAEQEVAHVKSCILYADHIRLYSPTVSLIRESQKIAHITNEASFELMFGYLQAMDQIDESVSIENLKTLAAGPSIKGWTRKAEKKAGAQRNLRLLLSKARRNIASKATEWYDHHSFRELRLVEDAGLLSFATQRSLDETIHLHLLDFVLAAQRSRPALGAAERNEAFQSTMIELLMSSVQNKTEYPLLDDRARQLISAIMDTSPAQKLSSTVRTRAAATGKAIFGRLPLPTAPMDELLDLRTEVESVVARFRRGLLSASKEIQGDQWGHDFEEQASRIYDTHVAPALEEIEETLQAPARRRLFDVAANGIHGFSLASGISIILQSLVEVTPIIVGGMGLIGAGASAMIKKLQELHQQQDKARKNDWFLVYQARRKLEQ